MGSDEPMTVSPAHAPASLGVSKAGVAMATFLIVRAIRGNEDYSALRSIWVFSCVATCLLQAALLTSLSLSSVKAKYRLFHIHDNREN
jgi:hypothetical protein